MQNNIIVHLSGNTNRHLNRIANALEQISSKLGHPEQKEVTPSETKEPLSLDEVKRHISREMWSDTNIADSMSITELTYDYIRHQLEEGRELSK